MTVSRIESKRMKRAVHQALLAGLTFLSLSPMQSYAQTLSDTYFVLLPDEQILEEGTHLFRVEHRFNAPIDGDSVDNGFGLDSGAKIRLQWDYAPWKTHQFSISRSSPDGTFALNWLKQWTLTNLQDWQFVSLLGADIPIGRDEIRDNTDTSINAGLIAGWQPSDQWHLSGSALFASQSRPSDSLAVDGDYSLAIALAARWWISPSYSVELEVIKSVVGYEGDNHYPVLSLAGSYHYGLHTFQLVLTNHRYLNLSQFIATRGMQDGRDAYLGFAISRKL